MPRRYQSPGSSTAIGAVRHYFGLKQEELAWFLDVSKAIIGHIEAGRRAPSLGLLHRLLPLARHLPAPPPAAPPAGSLPATAPAPEAAPLAARRAECLAKAAQLRCQLAPLAERAWYASRWQQALPAVLAELPAHTPEEQETTVVLRPWLARKGEAFQPAHVARYHLLCLQAEALEAEAAALGALLQAPAS